MRETVPTLWMAQSQRLKRAEHQGHTLSKACWVTAAQQQSYQCNAENRIDSLHDV